jgi:hypothetical protein
MLPMIIPFSPIESEYTEYVMVGRIVRLSKVRDDQTRVHLDTGDVIDVVEPMQVLAARINGQPELVTEKELAKSTNDEDQFNRDEQLFALVLLVIFAAPVLLPLVGVR